MTAKTEALRKAGIAEASERAAKLALKSAEAVNRQLKEELARTKILVSQTRSQCANEVRKREKVIEGLKKHVSDGGRQRGSGKAVGVRVVDVVPGVGDKERRDGDSKGVREDGYDLRSETNEFLTELARGLSEENENFGGMMRRTVDTLKELSGCANDPEFTKSESVMGGMDVSGGHDVMASELEEVLQHLRTLLTNPSFVPLEEVEIREEEIIRLREGWEKMEHRWKEAVSMMDGWRKRMARSGQTVNLEELQLGLSLSPLKEAGDAGERLGLSMIGEEEGEGDTQADIDAMSESEDGFEEEMPDPDDIEGGVEEEFEEQESSLFNDDPHTTHHNLKAESEEAQHQEDNSLESLQSSPVPTPPQLSPLREAHGNITKPASSYPNGPQKENFTTIVEENTLDLLDITTKSAPRPEQKAINAVEASPSVNPASHNSSIDILQTSSTSSSVPSSAPRSRSRSPAKPTFTRPTTRLESKPQVHSTPSMKLRNLDASSRLPRPQNEGSQKPQQSPLTMATIAAKLAATEREADAARVRAKLKAARMSRLKTTTDTSATVSVSVPLKSGDDEVGGQEAEKDEAHVDNGGVKDVEGAKKRKPKAQGGRANRRRSTLSPWEMESLILGGLGGGSPLKESS